MRLIFIALVAAGLGSPAVAQTYRSVDASPTQLVFIEEGSRVRADMHASVRAFSVMDPPIGGDVVAMDGTFSFDCGANTYSLGEQVAYRADLSEVARQLPFGPAEPTGVGTLTSSVFDYACSNTINPQSQLYEGRAAAVSAGQRILAARRAGQ